MNGSIRRIRRLLSLEKATTGPRPAQATPATPRTAGERTLSYHGHFGPRQSF